MGGACGKCANKRIVYRVLASKHEFKRPLGIPRSRWEDNTNVHLQVTGWSVDWINMAQDSDKWPELVKTIIKIRGGGNEGNSLTS